VLSQSCKLDLLATTTCRLPEKLRGQLQSWKRIYFHLLLPFPKIPIDQELNEQFSEGQLQDAVKNVAQRCNLLVVCALLSTASASRLSEAKRAKGYNPMLLKKSNTLAKPRSQPQIIKRAPAATSSACTSSPPPNPTSP
jgi:hypothetical protein